MTMKVSQNLNSMQKMRAQWNQQLNRYVFSKLIECLEKLNTWINTKHSKTNKIQKNIEWKTNELRKKYSNLSMGIKSCGITGNIKNDSTCNFCF